MPHLERRGEETRWERWKRTPEESNIVSAQGAHTHTHTRTHQSGSVMRMSSYVMLAMMPVLFFPSSTPHDGLLLMYIPLPVLGIVMFRNVCAGRPVAS